MRTSDFFKMIIKWLDHASFLIKVKGKKFYVDLYAGEYSGEADVILVSHGHRDHCDNEKIAVIRGSETLIITSEECVKGLSGNISAMSPGDVEEVHSVTIEAVGAYNYKRFRDSGVPYHTQGTGIGFVIEADGKRIYHAGDTDFLSSMEELRGIDVALLLIMGRAVKDLDEAVEAAVAINPKVAIHMYRRGMSEMEFKEKVEANSDIKVLAMKPEDEIDP